MHAMSSAVATAIFRRACRLFRMMQLVICSIIQNRLTALIRLYKANGLVAKEKRMGGHKNNVRAHSLADLEWAVAFITNYADDHGLALLGRIPGWRKDAAKLLASSETKVKVHGAYKSACLQGGKSVKRTREYNNYCTFHCVRYIHSPCLLSFDIIMFLIIACEEL